MKLLYLLFAVAITILSFYSWSKEEDRKMRSNHYCFMVGHSAGGGIIYSCSYSPVHNYTKDKGGEKKWLPKLFSILILAALILGLYLEQVAKKEDAGGMVNIIALLFALVFVGYCIYYFFAYDDLKVIYWFAAGLPVVGLYVVYSEET